MMYDFLVNVVFPVKIIGYTLLFLPGTLLARFTNSNTNSKAPRSSFKHEWFARFWSWFGVVSQVNNAPNVAPLLAQASGSVLDIGTGAGHWLKLYDKSKITRIYAIETNREQHPGLLNNARKAGLHDRFEIEAVPVEELTRTGIAKGSFDTIVTCNVLCSADSPDTLTRAAYELLKPGGQWIVYEHVKANSRSGFINFWQQTLNLVWPFFLGGCSLCRDTHSTLRAAGAWSKDSVGPAVNDSPYSVIPSIAGVLVK